MVRKWGNVRSVVEMRSTKVRLPLPLLIELVDGLIDKNLSTICLYVVTCSAGVVVVVMVVW